MSDIDMIQKLAKQNNEWSAKQAKEQMAFQERMSNTAHQREVADLKAAGLNPVLSANAGASSPTGAMGETDTSNVQAIASIAMEQARAMSASANARAASEYYSKNPLYRILEDIIEGYSGTDAKTAAQNAGKWLNSSGLVNSVVTAAKNVAAAVANIVSPKNEGSGSSSSKGGRDGKWWTPW